jgi:hypothetical protein
MWWQDEIFLLVLADTGIKARKNKIITYHIKKIRVIFEVVKRILSTEKDKEYICVWKCEWNIKKWRSVVYGFQGQTF